MLDAMEPILARAPRRRRQRLPPGHWLRRVGEAALLVVGVFVIALAFNRFLVPHHIASGGVVGVSTVLLAAVGASPALVQFAANAVILVLGWLLLGRGAALRALAGSLLLPVAVLVTTGPSWADDQLLAALAGGAGLGAGVGLALRSGSTIGGFSLLARMIDRHTGLGIATSLALLDGSVVVAAGLVSQSPQAAVLALATVFATTRAVDLVNTGLARAKAVWIVSPRADELRRAVLEQLDLGLTVLQGRGGLSDQPRDVLMVVVAPGDLWRVKQLISSIDPDAFTTVADAHEVLGHGFHDYERPAAKPAPPP